MNKKLQVFMPLLLAGVMTVGMWIGYKLKADTGSTSSFLNNAKSSSVQEILNLIQDKYVDTVSLDTLKESAISEMLRHLDPHSLYIAPKELDDVNEDLQGNFQGIGVEFRIFNDTVNIVNVIAGGPSSKAGVQVGDKFIKVNDSTKVANVHISPDDIKKLLRGQGGSKVNITLLHGNTLKTVTIQRGTIPLPSVEAAYIIAPGKGFIRISKFSETTYQEFMAAMESLQKQGMQQLILDLRGNGGGILQEAVNIADEFLDNDKMIVYTKGSHVDPMEYHCEKEGVFEKGKLTVLVDETSASASEILSGALQDWDRATIIGRRTFGKGLVQQQFNLSDGGALRLTVARYYTPLGRNIQKPYDNNNREGYEDELLQRFQDGEVLHGDTSRPAGPAYKTKGGHTVYGGGGITPDVFVPFDTTSLPQPIRNLYFKGTLGNFVYIWYMQNKPALQAFKTPHDLYLGYHPGENEWKQLTAFAKKDSIDLTTVSPKAKNDLLSQLPENLARQIWSTEGYYEVSNQTDSMVTKALRVMQ